MMTDERWQAFAERVPAGTRIRGDESDNTGCAWEGILLENKPHCFEDFIALIPSEYDKKLKRAKMPVRLSMQSFDEVETSTVMFDYPDVRYFLKGKWLSFDEVMALPSP